PFSNDLTALTFSLSECFDFFISFGFSCYKITTFCPLLICPIFGEGYKRKYIVAGVADAAVDGLF
ncbi:MAG: hypothetical protein J6Y47_08020, partial [Bacteroidales bacterium]|nr:hypothetical protein [Bacteroidales bacterium]